MIRWCLPFLLFLAGPLFAQQDALDAAAQLRTAHAQLAAASSKRDRIAALTQTVQAYEAGLTAVRAEQRNIALQEAELSQKLATERTELAQLLGVLSAISRTPQPVLRAHPDGSVNAARAGMLVADLAPALQTAVTELRRLLEQTLAVKRAQDVVAQTLADGLQGAQMARTALGIAVSERTDLPARFEDDPVQTALLVASADSLGDFAQRIARARPDDDSRLVPAGNLPLPVTGTILPDDGSQRQGLRIGTAPRALVRTPAPATLLFQGPLLDYGTVVVLEPAADVLFIIAGLEQVFAKPGQVLPAGAPIGLVGYHTAYDDGILTENLDDTTGQRQQALYLEVREGQSPVDVARWFALDEE